MATIVTDAEGPGSHREILDYVKGVLIDNTTLKPGVFLSGGDDDGRAEMMARAMLFSIMHRLGVKRWLDPKEVARESFDAGCTAGGGESTAEWDFDRWWEGKES